MESSLTDVGGLNRANLAKGFTMSILDGVPSDLTGRIDAIAAALRREPQAVITRALEEFVQRYELPTVTSIDPFLHANSENVVIQTCYRIVAATDMQASDHSYFRNKSWQLLEGLSVGLFRDEHEWLSFSRVQELVKGGLFSLVEWFDAKPDRLALASDFVEMSKAGSKNADIIIGELERRLSVFHHSWLSAVPTMKS